MTLVELIVFGLATWRISSLLVDEVGPFRIFIRLRELVGITHDADDNIEMIPDRFLPGILSCIYCCSIYVGTFWTIMFYVCKVTEVVLLAQLIAMPFALSAIAIIVIKTR
jgi:hypothetical protein